MIRRITNVTLLLISIGIILFIIHTFYDVFTRQPQASDITAIANTVSGQVIGAGQTASTSVENAFDDTSAPLPGLSPQATISTTGNSKDSPTVNNTTGEIQITNSGTNISHISTTDNSSDKAGELLNQNPKLRNALPPVPVAPPPVTVEASGKFPAPVLEDTPDTNTQFPSPKMDNSFSNPNSNFPTPQ